MQRIALYLLMAVGLATSAQAATLNEKIVAFCASHFQKKIGDGDCADLATTALRECGGRGLNRKKDFPEKNDYVWGELIYRREVTSTGTQTEGSFDKVLPGDIIQFRNTQWKGTRESNGKTQRYSAHFNHHTAIVRTVQGKGLELGVYEQNNGGRRFVTRAELGLDDLQQGWVRIYRPIEK